MVKAIYLPALIFAIDLPGSNAKLIAKWRLGPDGLIPSVRMKSEQMGAEMSMEKLASVEAKAEKTGSNGRRIFFLDIENYADRAVLGVDDALAARESIERQFQPDGDDLIVIGTSHSNNFMNASLAWKGPRHVLKPGRDGADLALLKAIGEYRLETFDEVFLMSGDGIFADKAAELVAQGVNVTVVSRPGSLSWRLVAAAPYMLAA
ncbi:MAG: NYN domain-containing protein [Eggerthellaceae bacterium]|nr:NYN domain-containing protein [Eggerthellaceae bacterium]